MPIYRYAEISPLLGDGVFLAPSAVVVGDVELGDNVSLWFHAVARGDVNTIRVGARTNVQDQAVLHVTHETHPLVVGSDVVVGHGAILHGCTVEDGALIGIGARVLDGARIGRQAQVAAGALVAPGQSIPEGTLAMGLPARIKRSLSTEERAEIGRISRRYLEVKKAYSLELGRGY